MIFPESELSTYLGFFIPPGQVDPLLDRIAEASSAMEEMDLVSFLHLAQRELELTGDVNRDDAAVVLVEELQLPLADAAAVLEETPAITAERLQTAWADVPPDATGPLPIGLGEGLILLEPGLELDADLSLDPALLGVGRHTPPEPEPEMVVPASAQDHLAPPPKPVLEGTAGDQDDRIKDPSAPDSAAQIEPEPGEAERNAAGGIAADGSDDHADGSDDSADGRHADDPDSLAPITGHPEEPSADVASEPAPYDPYAQLSPASLEASAMSFPLSYHDEPVPVTAAALLEIDETPITTISEPHPDALAHAPVEAILDGDVDASVAFPSDPTAGAGEGTRASERSLDELSDDASPLGPSPIAHAPAVGPSANQPRIPHPPIQEAVIGMPPAPESLVAQPPGVEQSEADSHGAFDTSLMDAFGALAMPDQTPPSQATLQGDEWVVTSGWLADQPQEGVESARGQLDTASVPAWMRGQTPNWGRRNTSYHPQLVPVYTPTGQRAQPASAWSVVPATPDPTGTAPPDFGQDGEDTQQIPMEALIAELDQAEALPSVGVNVADAPVKPSTPAARRSTSPAQFGQGAQDEADLPTTFYEPDPTGEIGLDRTGVTGAAHALAPVPGSNLAQSLADLTDDDAVESAYEEEFVADEPSGYPMPDTVWIPGMAERVFRATPWQQIHDDAEPDGSAPENLHGFEAGGVVPPAPEPETTKHPAEKMQLGDAAAFMADGPAPAPEWDAIDEGRWVHADYGPKRPKANRMGQIIGLLATALAVGVVYLYLTWAPLAAALTALAIPVPTVVIILVVAGVLGSGGISMFVGSSIPKKPRTVVVRKRRRVPTDTPSPEEGVADEDGETPESTAFLPDEEPEADAGWEDPHASPEEVVEGERYESPEDDGSGDHTAEA